MHPIVFVPGLKQPRADFETFAFVMRRSLYVALAVNKRRFIS
jgi:hypothetical protein